MKLLYQVSCLILVVNLTACSVMSRQECLTADWYLVGYEDGANGYTSARVGDYRKDCAEYGVTPDLENYRLGRRSGISKYCTAARGYAEGVEGNSYKGVCPYESEADFLSGYRKGETVYQAKKDWDDIRGDLRSAQYEIEKLDKEIRKKENKLIQDGLSSKQRADILHDINNLRDKKQRLYFKIRKLENDERWSKQNYESMRYKSAW